MDLESKHLHNCNLITKLNHTPTELPIATDCCFFFSIFFSFYGFLNLSSSIAIFISFPCAASRFSKQQNLDIHNHKVSFIFIFFFSLYYKRKMLFKIEKVRYLRNFRTQNYQSQFWLFFFIWLLPKFSFYTLKFTMQPKIGSTQTTFK